MGRYLYFYSYQVIIRGADGIVCCGSGEVKSNLPVSLSELQEMIKEEIDKDRKKQELVAINWIETALHILAFNTLPI